MWGLRGGRSVREWDKALASSEKDRQRSDKEVVVVEEARRLVEGDNFPMYSVGLGLESEL